MKRLVAHPFDRRPRRRLRAVRDRELGEQADGVRDRSHLATLRPGHASVKGYACGMDPLAVFSAPTRDWFGRAFAGPTPAQELAWPAIETGAHVLVQAPTGSGKTLAAFLIGIDRLNETPGRRAAPALRQPAQGAQLRHRAQPARPAGGARLLADASASGPAIRRSASASRCSASRPTS